MADSLATFRTALCNVMETLGYTYQQIDLKGTPSSQIDKAYFVESRLVDCDDESGKTIRKRRQFDVNFSYGLSAGAGVKAQHGLADAEVENVEDAIIKASLTDLLQLDSMKWENKVVSGYLLATVTLTATYWRSLT
jgi:hypothetical protein